jgi:valine--pyruvate aminotransferase
VIQIHQTVLDCEKAIIRSDNTIYVILTDLNQRILKMKFSDFGHHFSGYSGITHLMDDLSEGLSQPDVVMLGGGNPAPIDVVQKLYQATLEKLLESGELMSTLSNYDGPQGHHAFRAVLAEYFSEKYGWKVSVKNIAITHGSQSTFYILFNSFAGKSAGSRKQVLIPLVPEYIGYCDVGIEDEMLTSQQAKIKLLDQNLFKYEVDFEQLEVSSTTGLICVSRPTNPSGNVLTDTECDHLDMIARKNNIPLMIDSAYGTPFPNIIFGKATPFWNDNTIVCMSLSKLGLPGARTGIVVANEELIKYFSNFTAISSLAPAGMGPAIAKQLIEDDLLTPLCRDIIRPFYQHRAAFAVALVSKIIDDRRLHIHKPEGAFFLWLWFEGLPISTDLLYQRLKLKGLLVVPGKYFFPGQKEVSEHGQSCIRINVAQSEEDLTRGVEILAQELAEIW